MDIPTNIQNIIVKENTTYDEIRKVIINATKEVEQEMWEVDTKLLSFPVKLTTDELFHLIEFFFLHEYDEGVYVHIYETDGIINVECDHNSAFFMLALIGIFAIGVLVIVFLLA